MKWLLVLFFISPFVVKAQDAGVTTLLSPVNNACGSKGNLVTVIVKNYGSSSLSNIPVSIVISGSGSFSSNDTLKKTISSSKTDTLTFASKFNTLKGGTYSVKVYTNVSGDSNHSNDTLKSTVTLKKSPNAASVSDTIACKGGTFTLKNKNPDSGSVTVWYKNNVAFGTGTTLKTTLNTTTAFQVYNSFTQPDSIATKFTGGNSQTGNMYDVKVKQDIDIIAFYISPTTSGKDSAEFYYRTGTYSGHQSSSSGWTKVGGASFNNPSSGTGTAVRVAFSGLPLHLKAGNTYGFYVRLTGSNVVNYTNGSGSAGSDSFYNSYLTVFSGDGIAGLFAGSFSPRIWNGRIVYAVPGCLSDPQTLNVIIGLTSFDLKKGSFFKGKYAAGTSKDPDIICTGDSVKYDITPGGVLSQADYGTRWTVSSVSLKTAKGYAMSNMTYVSPTTSDKGYIVVKPKSGDKDSTYILTVKMKNISAGCDSVFTRYIFISDLPKAAMSFSTDCENKKITFINKSTPDASKPSGSYFGYTWYFGDGTKSAATSPTHYYTAAGTYTVSLVMTNGSCKDSTSSSITIYPGFYGTDLTSGTPFQGRFKGGSKADPDLVCIGDTLRYDLKIPSAFNLSDYGTKWSVSSFTLQTAYGNTTSNKVVSKPSTSANGYALFYPKSADKDSLYLLTVTVKSLQGSCDTTISRYIQVFDKMKAGLSVANGCQAHKITFINKTVPDTSTISGKKIKYTWYFGNGNISNDYAPTFYYRDSGTYTISVVADNTSCKDSASQTIRIYPNVLGASLTKGNPYKGLYNNGTLQNPDKACGKDTITYEIVPPSNFANSDYGQKWKITKVAVSSYGLNTVLSDTMTALPTASKNYNVRIIPPYKYADSVLVLNISLTGTVGGCDTSFKRYIKISRPPIANFGFTEVCEGQETTFLDSTDKNGNSFVGYYWNFGDGSTATQSYPTHTYNKAGTYDVTLTVISSQGCSDQKTKKVTVYAMPEMKFVTSALCAGEKVTFIDSSKTAGKVIKYYWEIGPTFKSGLASPVYTFTKAGKYKVKLAIVVSTGCVDTLLQEIEVVNKPKADFTFTGGCIGMSSTFTNTSTGDSTMTYFWDFGDGTTSTDKNPTKTYYIGGSSQVTLTVKAGTSGCTSSSTKTIAPFDLPKAKIGYTTNCAGSPVSFYDSSNYANSAFKSLKWDFGDGNSVVDKGTPAHIYSNAGTYTVSLWIQNANGCTDSTEKVIKVNAQPSADFSATTVCVGQPTVFTNNSTSSGGVPAYEWDFGDTTSNSSAANPTHTYKYAGSYNAVLKVTAGGCSAIKKVDVTVNPGPVPSWTTTMLGRKVTFNPVVTTYSSYMWYFGDGDSSSLVSPSHIYSSSTGTYTVTLKVTDAQGCKGEKTVVMKLGTGIIEEVENKWNVNVYPNPFNGTTKVSYTLEKRSTVKLSLWDIQGREMMLLKDGEIQAAGEHEVVIDGSKMPAGVYILKVIVGEQCYNTKIVQLK